MPSKKNREENSPIITHTKQIISKDENKNYGVTTKRLHGVTRSNSLPSKKRGDLEMDILISNGECKDMDKKLVKEVLLQEDFPGKRNNSSSKKECKSGDFDTLVLSGGGVHSLCILGALQYAKDNFILENIQTYVGTSAGAICGYLLAIGYTPQDIMVYLCTNNILERIKNFNLVAMLNGSGGTSFSPIHEILEKMTIEKIGKLLTLKDLYSKYKKKFICTTHNLTTDKPEILSFETYPDMPCLIAIRMSSNLPFIFDHFHYMESYYIDGAISNNFPINIGDQKGNKTLGLFTSIDSKKNFSGKNENPIEYIYYLLSIAAKRIVSSQIDNVSRNCKIIRLIPTNVSFFNFSLNTKKKLELFSSGYDQMKKLLFPSND